MLLMLLFGTLLAWHVSKARKQQKAVAWVREMSGTVLYAYEVDENGALLNNPQLPGPARLIDLLGIDFFDHVQSIRLQNARIDDFSRLHGMTYARQLNLAYTDVSDLLPLTGMPNVRDLNLYGTEVTDLSPLAGMTPLQRLCIDHTRVSDLTPLAELSNIRRFYCRDTSVSDLSPLAANTGMLSLDLTCTPVSACCTSTRTRACPRP
jgi:Leucine-rich repeat (LRR) protein